jgi:hypothetical protein
MMLLPLLCFLMLSSGCTAHRAIQSKQLYKPMPWPEPVGIEKQSGVAKYIVRGKSAYDSCTVRLAEIQKGTQP